MGKNWNWFEVFVFFMLLSGTVWADQALNLATSQCGQVGNAIMLSGKWGPNPNQCRWKQDGSSDYVTGDLSYLLSFATLDEKRPCEPELHHNNMPT